MADNYLEPVNNHFAFNESKLEDVDDKDFLNNSRLGGRTDGSVGRTYRNDANSVPDNAQHQQQSYLQRRRDIEERSLQSTQRSLGLLYDTEEVGNATAVELAKQREQLERTNKNLDDINATLRYSQRHLNGIKSVFGSIKNYFSGKSEPPAAGASPSVNVSADPNDKLAETSERKLPSPSEKYDQHPISRIRDDATPKLAYRQNQQAQQSNAFEDQLEANLNEMCNNLSRLKGLACDLGTEIEAHNELLDDMNYKIEDIDIKMAKQNKDMNKLLGKK